MNPAIIIAFVNLALDTIERFIPEIKKLTDSGEISAAQQQQLLDRIAKLRPGGGAFDGPEWQA